MVSGKRGWFYGWYFKCQSDIQTLAVIPAVHQTGGIRSCSIQIITEKRSWTVPMPGTAFRKRGRMVSIGGNRFGGKGIRLAVRVPGLEVKGKLRFTGLHPLKYGIMGPFSFVPFMECRHSIWSMRHTVNGTVSINGEAYVFDNEEGYWEGDRGRSFPREYVWTQCLFSRGSLMLSVASIPVVGIHFQGVIGIVFLDGREYRLATYLGAKADGIRNGLVRVTQGSMELEAELLEGTGNPLRAPTGGDMVRTIRENVACRARYRFRQGGRTLLAFETDRASFEYEYNASL